MEWKKQIASFIPQNYVHSESILYILEFKSINEHFYKIGITSQSIRTRVNNLNCTSNRRYDIKIILESDRMPTTLIRKIEIECHHNFKKEKYIPLNKFPGHTECFKIIDIEYITKLLNNE